MSKHQSMLIHSSSDSAFDLLFFFFFSFFSDPSTAGSTSESLFRFFFFSFFSFLAFSVSSSSSGATNAFSRSFIFSSRFIRCLSITSSFCARSLASLDKKYSPDSICRSTLLFSGAGGKGV
ncbi:uncharacterized protein ANIA_10749 [Aspergillus nidulans FGSC A4]|uniref:Uncharacterized protein n=1 Tax=Emericella nidulans (strain FGSC A4 / ATCC 38163 / CBS 112.46 / NRRL 194 / M139) TaxID=227321 RepID=C8UZX8_EMENI|nr:hypothetical protein [Aspergillus nidulans FGSC A4]CBF70656.1 TPA: conserved hypothetical protein [Aspergillus nidulans FGSC A4]